jgi:hypothetical protein
MSDTNTNTNENDHVAAQNDVAAIPDSQSNNSQSIVERIAPSPIDKVDIFQPNTSKVRDLFSAIIKLNHAGTFHEPTCPVCSHPLRSEAEDLYMGMSKHNASRFKEIKEFFLSKNEKITIDAIKNHFQCHVDEGDSQLRKIEYIETLDNLVSIKMSTIEEVDLMLAALKERMLEVAKLSPDRTESRSDIEQAKSNMINQTSKSVSNLLQLRAKLLGEMRENGEVVVIPRNKFKEAFNNALQKVRNDDEKQLIVELLKDISNAEDKSSARQN